MLHISVLFRYGLFSQTSTSDRLLIPNTAARFLENGIQMIEFLGRIIGKALYEGILLDYSFSHVFVQKLLGRYSFIDELSTLDPEIYRNLMYVKVKVCHESRNVLKAIAYIQIVHFHLLLVSPCLYRELFIYACFNMCFLDSCVVMSDLSETFI